jgi:Ser/Thr protein kinase RdoA (MazF antagonist)
MAGQLPIVGVVAGAGAVGEKQTPGRSGTLKPGVRDLGLARPSSPPPPPTFRRVRRTGHSRTVPWGELPDWLPAWCAEQLGDEPVGVLFALRRMSAVFGLRLAGGREVVVKAREDGGRAASCVAAQARLAERGFPCARPLTPAVGVGALAVHAEEFRPGGELLRGDSPDVAARCAAVFARLVAGLSDLAVAPPLPNPRWVRWDHPGPGLWPAIRRLDDRDQSAVPAHVVDAAARARARLLAADLPCVLGHADFEAQNLRWRGGDVWAVHDWDSLAWQPEAALVGAACGAFASASPPTLAPVGSSAAFLAAYQDLRGRRFTPEEREVAWAASLWPAAHNARWEAVHGDPPVSGAAVRAQAAERLRRAGA